MARYGRKKASSSLPVIIREEKESRTPLAIFPIEPGTNDPSTMSCYAHLGQHSTCTSAYVSQGTRPASPAQVREMLKELRSVGYTDLRVVARLASSYYKIRKAACR